MKNIFLLIIFLPVVSSFFLISCDGSADSNYPLELAFSIDPYDEFTVEDMDFTFQVLNPIVREYTAIPSDPSIASVEVDGRDINVSFHKQGTVDILVTEPKGGMATVRFHSVSERLHVFDRQFVQMEIGQITETALDFGVGNYEIFQWEESFCHPWIENGKLYVEGYEHGKGYFIVRDERDLSLSVTVVCGPPAIEYCQSKITYDFQVFQPEYHITVEPFTQYVILINTEEEAFTGASYVETTGLIAEFYPKTRPEDPNRVVIYSSTLSSTVSSTFTKDLTFPESGNVIKLKVTQPFYKEQYDTYKTLTINLV